MAYPNLSYFADVRNLNSYYAYGKDLPTGTYSSSGSYSYGFNGKERESHKDGQYDFGARIMNTDFPMFLSRDPKEQNFVSRSPYTYAADNPINFIDVNGEQPGKVRSGVNTLIIGIQGWAGSPVVNDDNSQTKNNLDHGTDSDGIGAIQKFESEDVQVFIYVAGGPKVNDQELNYTEQHVSETIQTFKAHNPDGKVILVGHSEGAIQALNGGADSGEIIDLTILVDMQADPDINVVTPLHTPKNFIKTINYFDDDPIPSVNGALVNDASIGGHTVKPLFKNTTVENRPISNTSHTDIDQDTSSDVENDIDEEIGG